MWLAIGPAAEGVPGGAAHVFFLPCPESMSTHKLIDKFNLSVKLYVKC